MRSERVSKKVVFVLVLAGVGWGCNSSTGGGGAGGAATTPSGSGGSVADGTGGATKGTGGATTMSSGGAQGTGGVPRATGGSTGLPGAGGRTGRPDASAGTGGTGTGGTGAGGSTIDGGASTGGCTIGAWPTADPSKAGPYKTVTENDVGPQAGEALDGGVPPKFTMFRPQNLDEVSLCHPVITWGNGTGSTPNMYGTLLKNFASHGFVVIASNNTNVARGNPAPMIVGVTWVLQQNDDPSSVLYHRLDTTHIGATGHSQGAMATAQASGDSHITTSVPIEGASAQRNLHGPAMFFCGGQDTIVGCNGATSALAAVTTLPAMFAELNAVDHGSWMSRGSTLSAADTAFTAWMRVHLMGDTELRPWFYGPSCKLCTDTAWTIDRKNMDQ